MTMALKEPFLSLTEGTESSENQEFSHDTQQIAYLAPMGASNHATRDCVWGRF